MLAPLAKAVGQLGDRDVRRVVWKSLGAVVALYGLLAVALWFLIGETRLFDLAWLEVAVDVLGGLAALVLAWLFLPGAMGMALGLFLEDVAAAVERRHYPELGDPRKQPMGEIFGTTVKFAGLVAGINLLILPLYFVPVVNIFVFYVLNGYLLGREYFELVALRRLDAGTARRVRRRHARRLWTAGMIIALLASVPVVNLVAPVVATAFMVHVVEGLRRRQAAAESRGLAREGETL